MTGSGTISEVRHAKFGRPKRGRLAPTTNIRGHNVTSSVNDRQPLSRHSTTNTLLTTMVKHIILIHTRNGNYIQFKQGTYRYINNIIIQQAKMQVKNMSIMKGA